MAKTRKTKKEKMRTAGRAAHVSLPPSQEGSTPSPVYTYITPGAPKITNQQGMTTQSLSFLREDLTRTFVVIASILIAEITLYYALTAM